MQLLDRTIKGIPVTFLAALALVILLTIFFGAWAVSADAKQPGRELSFLAPGASGFGPIGVQRTGPDPGNVSSSGEEGAGAADSWWGKAFLKACPLH